MRFSLYLRERSLNKTIDMIEKNFSPERKKIQDEILSVVRDVQTGRGDKMEQAMKLTALTKNELVIAKSADNDSVFS